MFNIFCCWNKLNFTRNMDSSLAYSDHFRFYFVIFKEIYFILSLSSSQFVFLKRKQIKFIHQKSQKPIKTSCSCKGKRRSMWLNYFLISILVTVVFK